LVNPFYFSLKLNAICTELGATLFDLTATNIVGKYPGKSGLNMLLHLVIKVSRFGYDLEQLLKQLMYSLQWDGFLLSL
jgi:hypothetical protein